jgi:hypothetical protein
MCIIITSSSSHTVDSGNEDGRARTFRFRKESRRGPYASKRYVVTPSSPQIAFIRPSNVYRYDPFPFRSRERRVNRGEIDLFPNAGV